MLEFLKLVGSHGLAELLAASMLLAVVMTVGGWRSVRWVGLCLSAMWGAYLTLGMPIVAHLLADSLTTWRPSIDLSALPPPGAIMVLSGDNPDGRAREALRAHQTWPAAPVVVLGEAWFLGTLQGKGIPLAAMTQNPVPDNTLEQMVAVFEFAQRHSGSPPAVIASTLQMPRVKAFAEGLGVTLEFLPTAIDDEPSRAGAARWWPTIGARRISREALYEHAALVYYRWRGLGVSRVADSAYTR